jgi:hypothetical protein
MVAAPASITASVETGIGAEFAVADFAGRRATAGGWIIFVGMRAALNAWPVVPVGKSAYLIG